MITTKHPLMLSLSKHTRGTGPKSDAQRAAFDRLRLSGAWVLCLPAFMIAATAHAGPKPKPGFEAALPLPAPVAKAPDGGIFNAANGYAALTDGAPCPRGRRSDHDPAGREHHHEQVGGLEKRQERRVRDHAADHRPAQFHQANQP